MTAIVITCPHCQTPIELDGPGKFACFNCGGNVEVGGNGRAELPPVHRIPAQAEKLKRGRGFGWWTVVRALTWLFLLAPFLLWLAAAVSLELAGEDSEPPMLIIYAVMVSAVPIGIGCALDRLCAKASVELICSQCGNPATKHSTLCPSCRAVFR